MIQDLEIRSTESVPSAVIRLTIPRSEMGTEFPKAVHEILDALGEQGLEPTGGPYARHLRFDPETFDFEVGFPVAGQPEPSGRVAPGELPAARVVRTVYRGGYEGLPDAWQTFRARIEARGIDVASEFRERYVVGPEAGPDQDAWRTELSWVVADSSASA